MFIWTCSIIWTCSAQHYSTNLPHTHFSLQVPHGASNNKTASSGSGQGEPVEVEELEVRQGTEGAYVDGLTAWPAASADEALVIINRGNSNRKVISSNIHERSSRSHLVVQVTCDRLVAATGQRTRGQVCIDLCV